MKLEEESRLGPIGLQMTVSWKNFLDFIQTAKRYYSNWSFCKVDLSLLLLYLGNSPFAISKQFLVQRGEKDLYAYGETPLATMDHIAKECQLSSRDTLFELGCGRGRTCFWLNAFVGCKVAGIDYVPEFIKNANIVKSRFNVNGVEFHLQDMLDTDLSGATAIYLYGTCLEDVQIITLIDKFKKLPPGTKIITVSYPLTDYTHDPIFEVMKRFTGKFTWGEGDIYLQVRK